MAMAYRLHYSRDAPINFSPTHALYCYYTDNIGLQRLRRLACSSRPIWLIAVKYPLGTDRTNTWRLDRTVYWTTAAHLCIVGPIYKTGLSGIRCHPPSVRPSVRRYHTSAFSIRPAMFSIIDERLPLIWIAEIIWVVWSGIEPLATSCACLIDPAIIR